MAATPRPGARPDYPPSDLVLKGSALDSVFPHWQDVANASHAGRYTDVESSDEPVLLPVDVLRLTHHTINVAVAFGDDYENQK